MRPPNACTRATPPPLRNDLELRGHTLFTTGDAAPIALVLDARDRAWARDGATPIVTVLVMLSIGKLAAGQQEYYLRSVADGVEEYYLGSGEAPGRWLGDGAATLH